MMRENIALYQGYSYDDRRDIPDRRDWERIKVYGGPSNYITDRKIITNYIHEFIEARVSQVTSYRNIVQVYPANSMEEGDLANAQAARNLTKTIMYDNNMDTRQVDFTRNVFLCGDSFWKTCWNKDKGPELKASKLAKAKMRRIPMKNADGTAITDGSGKPKFFEQAVCLGDVDFKIIAGFDFSYEPVWPGMKPRYMFIRERENVDILQALHPDQADNIRKQDEGFYDYASGTRIRKGNHAEYFEFFYLPDRFVPTGFWCKFLRGALLEWGPFPYEIACFPGAYLSDIDINGLTRGFSFIRNTKPVQDGVNEMRYIYRRLMKLASNPKMVYEEESVDPDDLDARPGMVPISKGTEIQPYLLQLANLPSFMPEILDHELQELQRLNSIHPIAQGLPPANAKSGEAFKVLSQQYNVRSNSFQTKYNQCLLEQHRLALSIAHKYYPTTEDERLYKVFGDSDAEWLTENWKNANFRTSFDVRLETTSALGETEEAKVQNTLSMFREGLISADSAKENLGMANFDRAYGDEVAPYKAARQESDRIIKGEGKKVLAPAAWEDHKSHYITHWKAEQTPSFKKLPDWIKGDYKPKSPFFMKGHVGHKMAHVYLMVREVQFEMQFGSSVKLQMYSALPGWTLMAQYFMQGGAGPAGAEPPQPEGATGQLPGQFQQALPQQSNELPGSVGAPAAATAPSAPPPEPQSPIPPQGYPVDDQLN